MKASGRPRGRGMRWGSVRLGNALGLLVVMAVVPSLARGADNPAPRWVAADAAVYLELPRPAKLLDARLRPQVEAALKALPPVRKALKGSPYQTVERVFGSLSRTLELAPEEALRRLTAGGIVLAIEAPAQGAPRPYLIVTPEDADIAARASTAFVALARQHAANQGNPDPVKEGEYRGVPGYELGKATFAVIDGSLVVTDQTETLRRLVDRVRDGVKDPGPIGDDTGWKARRERAGAEALVWGYARLERLRSLDPKRFTVPEKLPPQATLLFGSWLEALRLAPWIEATLEGGDERLAATLTLPSPAGGYREALKGFVPRDGETAPGLLRPPGTIASLSLWRDPAAIWEARTELFTPEVQQGLAKLDTFAGQFFGGRDFGAGVLGALEPRWRLVVAHQDYDALSPCPDLKLPGFALVADLDPDDDDFHQRLKVAFQSFIGLANLGAAQKSQPPFELGSEVFQGVTLSTARYMVPRSEAVALAASRDAGNGVLKPAVAVHQRYNFTPAIAQVENHFILSTSTGLTRALIEALRTPAAPSDSTLQVDLDGSTLARLVGLNRNRLIMQNMLEKGHDQTTAATETEQLAQLLSALGQGRLTVRDAAGTVKFELGLVPPEAAPR